VTRPVLRDPQALPRFFFLLCAITLIWPMLILAQFQPMALFDASNREVMGNFLQQFFPPQLQAEFLHRIFKAVLETLAMATAGITLALVIAMPLTLGMTQSLSISRIGPANGYAMSQAGRYVVRLVMVVMRGIPEIVWALLFVRVFGLGPMAGVLAIAITYGGMLTKVYAEILESGNTQASRALFLAGSNRLHAFLYGLLPHTAQELASYTIYRWEAAVRASVVMGFVGAGGLGQLMDQSMKMLDGSEVSTILLVFLMLVFVADYVSWLIRKQLA